MSRVKIRVFLGIFFISRDTYEEYFQKRLKGMYKKKKKY
jgi:hypothetical protein